MSERPVAVTRTDEILLHLVDRVDVLVELLEGRDGAPAPEADVPTDTSDDVAATSTDDSTPVDEPADDAPKPAAKPAAKKTTSRSRKTADVSGR
jgi:hypothetical protein